MSTFADIITQINSLTGFNVPTASGYIISSSIPIGSGSVNAIVNQINTITGFNIPATSVSYISGSNVSGQPIVIYTAAPVSGTISTEGIYPGAIIKADHVLRIINALNGVAANDIVISGSLNVSGSTTIRTVLDLPFVPDQDFLYSSNGDVKGTDTVDGGTF